ncbi:MAG: hypothetical protein AAF512_09790 [Pseudomonadota bacterium]
MSNIMRCPECNANHRRRAGMTCSCGYRFVLTRQEFDITDFAFHKLIAQVSANDQHHFTRRQLATAICHYWHKKATDFSIAPIIIISIIVIILWSIFAWSYLAGGSVLALSLLTWFIYRRRKEPQLDFQKARQVVQQYHKVHPLERMIEQRFFQGNDSEAGDEDIFYAPDQMLIVERDELVDLLVLNGFHLTTRTAIVSAEGYPKHILAACEKFLETSPKMPVYVAHGISKAKANWVDKLKKEPLWQKFQDRIIDLGPDLEQIKNSRSLLPWLQGKYLYFSRKSSKYLKNGGTMALDSLPTYRMLPMLAGAVTAGALMIGAAAAAGASSGVGGGAEDSDSDTLFSFDFGDDYG